MSSLSRALLQSWNKYWWLRAGEESITHSLFTDCQASIVLKLNFTHFLFTSDFHLHFFPLFMPSNVSNTYFLKCLPVFSCPWEVYAFEISAPSFQASRNQHYTLHLWLTSHWVSHISSLQSPNPSLSSLVFSSLQAYDWNEASGQWGLRFESTLAGSDYPAGE